MNELDGHIRRFLSRLTDAAPDAPAATALLDHHPSSAGRPGARVLGVLAIVALAATGFAAVRAQDRGPAAVESGTTSSAPRTVPGVVCSFAPITMPDVVGLPLAEAESLLSQPCAEVRVTVHEIPSSDVSPGVVLTQSVPAGSTRTARGVVLEVAAPSTSDVACTLERVRVLPSVVGMTVESASGILAAPCLGLTLVAIEVTDPSYPPGSIIDQQPAAGQLVEPGGQVRVMVAVAPAGLSGNHVVGTFTLGDGSRRVIELEPAGLCISRGDDATRGCDTLPASLSPLVVFLGGDDPQEMYGIVDPELVVLAEVDGAPVEVQQTREPVAGHLAFHALLPAGGRLTIRLLDPSGRTVHVVEDVPRLS